MSVTSEQTREVPFSSKLSFGVGQMAEGVKTIVFNTFVLFYYNQILGVSATLTALALGLAVMFDAFSDPVAGYLSDRTVSRWGRRHPWIIASAIPLGITLGLLFNPPDEMSQLFYFCWLLISSISVRIFLTLFHAPSLALGAEMASDYIDRTRIFSYGVLFSMIAAYGFYFFSITVFFATPEDGTHGFYQPEQYLPFSVTAGAIVTVVILVSAFGTWKELPYLPKSNPTSQTSLIGFFQQVGSLFKNKSYVRIVSGLILGTTVYSVELVFNTYMGIHFWELPTEQIRWGAIALIAGLPLAVLLAPLMTQLFDKRMTLILSTGIAIIISNIFVCLRLFTDVIPENGHPVIFWCVMSMAFGGGIFGPIVTITINSMFADIADEQALNTGERQEGIIYSAKAFSLKATNAIGSIFGGIALDMIAFPRKAEPGMVDPEVIFNLGLVAGPVTSVFTFGGLVLYLGYRLDRRKVEAIKLELNNQRADK